VIVFKKSSFFSTTDARYILSYCELPSDLFKEWRVEAKSHVNVIVRLFIEKESLKELKEIETLNQKNNEPCIFCNGTGERSYYIGETRQAKGKCNECNGTGNK
jgi:hypothetical protein